MTEREEFVNWVATEWRPDDGAELVEKDWPRFAFAAFQAGRRTTPDREEIIDELCLALWDVRKLTGELSSDQIWTIREHFQKLKTAPNGEKG
ncbi:MULTISPECIES: hypothetical protein [Burkholderia]|uniref:Uncharacterized protein n=1 Tax=Burkholderia pyrrocinia TaxID=60550 RepID=A0A318J1Z5_BURPY|nr:MULTISPECIES: hypothetical protein [Burkholderia]PXX41133.1 hypothetical protein NA66_1001743 [Burkholderia pyrrocinia]SFW58575.1 hypothetical protein SAMN03159384_03058 [Burkholderia sp. NFACC33-1]SFY12171.1 hypothetical protein SAMN03159408_03270 [Burkholderia sp. NFPP32]